MASALELAKESYRRKKSRNTLNSNPPDSEQQQPFQLDPEPTEPPVEVSFRGYVILTCDDIIYI